MTEVTDGLREGEQVVLNPKVEETDSGRSRRATADIELRPEELRGPKPPADEVAALH